MLSQIILVLSLSFFFTFSLIAQAEVFEQKGKYGIRDMEVVLLAAKYDYIAYYEKEEIFVLFDAPKRHRLSLQDYPQVITASGEQGVVIAPQKYQLGLFDAYLLRLLKPSYSQLQFNDYAAVLAKNRKGEYLISRERLEPSHKKPFDEIIAISQGTLTEEVIEWPFYIKSNGKWGIKNLAFEGELLMEYIPIEYDSLAKLNDSNLHEFKAIKQGKWGIIEGEGNIVVPFEFDQIDDYVREDKTCMGCLIAQKDGGRGLFYSDYEKTFEIIPPKYDSMRFLNYDRLQLWKDGKMGIYEIKESTTADSRYETNELLAVAYSKVEKVSAKKDKSLNEVVFLPSFEWKETDYQVIYKEGRIGLLEQNGVTIALPAVYTALTFGPGKLLQLHKGNKVGIATLNNATDKLQLLYPEELDSFSFQSTDFTLVRVYQNGKVGLLNLNDFTQFPIEYGSLEWVACQALEDEIWGMENQSYFLAEKEGKYGFIKADQSGVLPLEYDRIEQYEFLVNDAFDLLEGGNYALLYKNGKMGLWGFCTELSLEAEYDEIKVLDWKGSFTLDYFLIKQQGKYGLYDYIIQKMVLPIEYDRISLHTFKTVEVQQGSNKEVLELKKLRDNK